MHTYTVVAVWSHHPHEGRIAIYFDGHLKMQVTGRDVNLDPSSMRLPEMKLGMYGDHAVGRLDVLKVQAGPMGASTGGETPGGGIPEPTVEPSVVTDTPTQIRMVAG